MIEITIEAKLFNYLNKFSSNEQTRYNLNGIRFARNGDIVATDGHKLGLMHNGFKVVQWQDDAAQGFTCITHYKDKGVERTIKNMSGILTINLEGDFITMTDEKGSSIKLDWCDQYPEYMRVIPEATDLTESNTVAFNPKYMYDFAGWEKGEHIKIEIHGDDVPMLVYNSRLTDFIGVLMPCRP